MTGGVTHTQKPSVLLRPFHYLLAHFWTLSAAGEWSQESSAFLDFHVLLPLLFFYFVCKRQRSLHLCLDFTVYGVASWKIPPHFINPDINHCFTISDEHLVHWVEGWAKLVLKVQPRAGDWVWWMLKAGGNWRSS